MGRFKIIWQRHFWTLPFFFFNIIFTFFVCAVYNLPFFEALLDTHIGWLKGLLVGVCLFFVFLSVHGILFVPPLTKWLAGFLCLANAAAFYFIHTYHILLNKTMLMNLLETNLIEAADFLTLSFFIYIFIFGLLPIFLIWKTKITYSPLKKEISQRISVLCFTLVLIAGITLPFKSALKIYLKENFNLRYQLLPSSYISSLAGVTHMLLIQPADMTHVSAGFKFERPFLQNNKHFLIVFVLGESARSANCSLNGYERDTNEPLYAFKNDLISFSDTVSCGVVTRVSLPCMFSHYERTTFNPDTFSYSENALNLLQKAGYYVRWIDNELGCNKVCRDIPTVYTCTHRDCHDGLLNKKFFEELTENTGDSFFVLHQRGSHGSFYHRRYPEEYAIFTPPCMTADLTSCSYEERINAYDNTIYYTSSLLADLIKKLSLLTDRFYPVVIYISDHGDSLGENQQFLHGGAWEDAPEYQKKIPFFLWMPEETREVLNLDWTCMKQMAGKEHSHDNIFHSLLGLAGVQVDVYQPELDIFSTCRHKEN